jgi:pimeloyl-ACP methyl ester carboxylesterase
MWHKLMHKLDTEGIRYYAFDYHSASNDDPRAVSSALFEPWMNQKKAELGYGDDPYNGKFDIICHSMGALVTRFYIEDNPANAQNIGRWIGIGPVNRGAAIADIYYHRALAQQLNSDPRATTKFFNRLAAVVPMNSPAVFSMQTINPEIIALNERFTPTGISYKIIEGTNATLLTFEAVEKTATGQFQFTLAGDGVVANAQSELPGVPIYKVDGANHLTLVDDSRVIAKVIEYLET